MSRDYWGFKDVNELDRNVKDMPDIILKEQVGLLSEKTGYELFGKATFIKVKSEDIDFKLATIFDVVVPSLDNYSKTILIMYSNPETDYPVAISVGNSYEEDYECFSPKHRCNDGDEFEQAIKEILTSEPVMNTVRILYSKAVILSRR